MKMKHLFPPDASKLIPILQPGHDELVVDKDRFSTFIGNDLKEVLRSGGIKHAHGGCGNQRRHLVNLYAGRG